ncbi:MAG: hypothetical protein K1X79_05470 [Oligoflexia bacterium]|nr:hypothetical protein [Oligoflexia bacterium]
MFHASSTSAVSHPESPCPQLVERDSHAQSLIKIAATLDSVQILADTALLDRLMDLAKCNADSRLQLGALQSLRPTLADSLLVRQLFCEVVNLDERSPLDVKLFALAALRSLVNSQARPFESASFYSEVRDAIVFASTENARSAVRQEASSIAAYIASDPAVYIPLSQAVDPKPHSQATRALSFEVRMAQVRALAAVSDVPAVREALLNILSGAEQNFEVRAAAIQVLVDGIVHRLERGFCCLHPQVVQFLFLKRDKNAEVQQVAAEQTMRIRQRFPAEWEELRTFAERSHGREFLRTLPCGSEFYRRLYMRCGHHFWQLERTTQLGNSRIVLSGSALTESELSELCRPVKHNPREHAKQRAELDQGIQHALNKALGRMLTEAALSPWGPSGDYGLVRDMLTFVADVGAYELISEVRLFQRTLVSTDVYDRVGPVKQVLVDLVELFEMGFEAQDKPKRMARLDARMDECSRYLRILIGLEQDPSKPLLSAIDIYAAAAVDGRLTGTHLARLGLALERLYGRDERQFFDILRSIAATQNRTICLMLASAADVVATRQSGDWVHRVSEALGV